MIKHATAFLLIAISLYILTAAATKVTDYLQDERAYTDRDRECMDDTPT